MDKQKPVALKMYRGELCYESQHDDQSFGMWCPITPDADLPFAEDTKFYTAPPKREWVGLTQEELQDLCVKSYQTDNAGETHFNRGYFADAIEAKLKEKNNG